MVTAFLNKCKAYLLDIFFPNRCPLCDEFIEWDKFICEECRSELEPAFERACSKCGKIICECDGTQNYDNVYAAMFFDDENVSEAIYNFKLTGMSNIARYTAEMLSGHIPDADVVLSVPMGRYKQRKRGHNQAEILAGCIAESLGIPHVRKFLFKKDTEDEQHYFSKDERAERVKDIFYGSRASLEGRRVILCDDVMTTGATADRCAEILKEMGAEKVIVCVCAITRLDKSQREG